MKVAHVTATFPPYLAGTGTVAYHNARLLQERGHEVTVFTAQTPRGQTQSFPFAVEYLPALFRLGNAPFTPSLLTKLRGFDLVHLHYPYIFGAELVLLSLITKRTPLVVTYHNRLEEQQPIKRLLFGLYNHFVEPMVLRGANKLLAVREEHLTSLYPKFKGRAQLAELANGVDVSLFKPQPKDEARATLSLPPDAAVALFVGALDQAHRFKNVDGLLKAFAQLPLPEAQLVIVGDGDLKPALETLASELGIKPRVHFLGKRSPEALPTIYSAADVTVLPSTGVESFGLVLIESLACATPIIASDLPGVRTLVEEGMDGRRVAPNDLTALTDTLKDVLSQREKAREMGQRGREKVRRCYDWQVIGDRLEQLYREVRQEVALSWR